MVTDKQRNLILISLLGLFLVWVAYSNRAKIKLFFKGGATTAPPPRGDGGVDPPSGTSGGSGSGGTTGGTTGGVDSDFKGSGVSEADYWAFIAWWANALKEDIYSTPWTGHTYDYYNRLNDDWLNPWLYDVSASYKSLTGASLATDLASEWFIHPQVQDNLIWRLGSAGAV